MIYHYAIERKSVIVMTYSQIHEAKRRMMPGDVLLELRYELADTEYVMTEPLEGGEE